MQAAAKHGVHIRFFMGDARRMTLRLQAKQGILVEHFHLQQKADKFDLAIRNAKGESVVEYPGLRKGDVRRWHELEVRCVGRSDTDLVLDLELKPGSTCFGPGVYALRTGLRVDLPNDRSVTVVRYDASQEQGLLEIREGTERRSVSLSSTGSGSIRLTPELLEDGGMGLWIDAP
jgi:hypothetical protein